MSKNHNHAGKLREGAVTGYRGRGKGKREAEGGVRMKEGTGRVQECLEEKRLC